MNVGELIKKERLAKGMTQEELAEKVGVKKSAVAKWENGRVSEIKRSNLKKIGEALGLDPVQLLGDRNNDALEHPVIPDGLTKDQKALVDFAHSLPEDKAALALRLLQSIVEAD